MDDSVSTPRGLALKVVGVAGEMLDGAGHAQDFVMVDGPAFGAPDPATFLGLLKPLAASTDRAQGAKKAISAVLRGAESAIEALGLKSPLLTQMGGHANTHVLGHTYYPQVPILYGRYMAKVAVAPVSPELAALARAAVDTAGRPNALRDAVQAFFAAQGGQWELRVQLCTDIGTMPIEDASVVWPEDQRPYVAVARLTMPPQPAWDEARSRAVDDAMSFSPWHGLAGHRPLGAVMRVRKAAYAHGAEFRASRNGCPMHEPGPGERLPA